MNPDAFLAACLWDCSRCGGAAYPTDAVFLAPQLVLATFRAAHSHKCGGSCELAALIDTSAADDQRVIPVAPKGNADRAREHYLKRACQACGTITSARYCDACRCQAPTAAGRTRRCRSRAALHGLCSFHYRIATARMSCTGRARALGSGRSRPITRTRPRTGKTAPRRMAAGAARRIEGMTTITAETTPLDPVTVNCGVCDSQFVSTHAFPFSACIRGPVCGRARKLR
jgi:hypothetical protein